MKEKSLDKKKIMFDPKQSYNWQPTDKFDMSGAEFDILYKNINTFINGPLDARAVLNIAICADILQRKFIENVENGLIKVVEEENK